MISSVSESSQDELPGEEAVLQSKRTYNRRHLMSPGARVEYEEGKRERRRQQQAEYMRKKRARILELPEAERNAAKEKQRIYQRNSRRMYVLHSYYCSVLEAELLTHVISRNRCKASFEEDKRRSEYAIPLLINIF